MLYAEYRFRYFYPMDLCKIGPDHNPGVVVNLRKKVHAVSM